MRTVSIFKIGANQAIRFPIEFEFDGVSELEITKQGDRIILEPARPSWLSFAHYEKADPDFMKNREDIIPDERRGSIE
jgi:antitoxin VapB